MLSKNILFEGSAVKEVLQFLQKTENYEWNNIRYINQGRYAIVKGINQSLTIAITLKKEWFLKFGTIIPNQKGIGDTLNSYDLKTFVKENVKIIYIMHSSGNIYKINLYEFLLKSYAWTNKEGKNVRSISIHEYKRVN